MKAYFDQAQKIFSWEETEEVFSSLIEQYQLQPSGNQRSFWLVKQGEKVGEVMPPMLQPIGEHSPEEYLKQLAPTIGDQLVILIQAGAAALGIWEEGELTLHKVITKYMVRKKQGKAQITYLNQKGKSRKGSRMRLRQSEEFFADINTKLQEWNEEIEDCDGLFFSCTARLWGELFRHKTPCPLEKEDERWQKIPLDVNVPNFKELQRVFFMLSHGVIVMPPLEK